jgi:UDP-N-acetylmuramyl-tripeptide synthetase
MLIDSLIKKSFSYDSRLLKKNELFFDFVSSQKKKNPFIDEILKKKPYKIITEHLFKKKNKFILKKKVKIFYNYLVKKKYSKLPENLVAVTGTNGKTSVANFYYQLLTLNKIPCASIGTLGFFYNKKFKKNNLTTPDNLKILNFLKFIKQHNINNAILEASSHGLVQGRLENLKFKNAIFTNFSQDHLDYHKSMKSYLSAKLILFKKYLTKKSNIICDDNIAKLLSKNQISNKNFNLLLQSKKKLPFKLISHTAKNFQTTLKINFNNNIHVVNVNLIGDIQIKNLYQSMIAAFQNGLKFNLILKSLTKIKPINGRLNIFKNHTKIVCLDYAHTPDGLEKAIMTLKSHFKKNINIVFGCGGDRDSQKRKKMGKIAAKYCKNIILTDDNPRNENPNKIISQIYNGSKKGILIRNRKMAIKKGINLTKPNEILLVAGKGHENYQIIKNKKIFFSDAKEIKNNL